MTAPTADPGKKNLVLVALIALGGLVGVLVLIAIVGVAMFNSNQKTMVAKETRLNAQYLANQNELSTYISTIKESLGVADRSTSALDQVLSDAVKGRYDGAASSAQPGRGQLFSAITEAYPDLSKATVNYSKVQDAVFSGRQGYKDVQNKLLDMIREYDTWRSSGLLHSQIVSMIGAPSDHLVARIGTTTTHGQAALDQMNTIVTTAEGQRAYQTGTMDPLNLNDKSAPPVQPSAAPTR